MGTVTKSMDFADVPRFLVQYTAISIRRNFVLADGDAGFEVGNGAGVVLKPTNFKPKSVIKRRQVVFMSIYINPNDRFRLNDQIAVGEWLTSVLTDGLAYIVSQYDSYFHNLIRVDPVVSLFPVFSCTT